MDSLQRFVKGQTQDENSESSKRKMETIWLTAGFLQKNPRGQKTVRWHAERTERLKKKPPAKLNFCVHQNYLFSLKMKERHSQINIHQIHVPLHLTFPFVGMVFTHDSIKELLFYVLKLHRPVLYHFLFLTVYQEFLSILVSRSIFRICYISLKKSPEDLVGFLPLYQLVLY